MRFHCAAWTSSGEVQNSSGCLALCQRRTSFSGSTLMAVYSTIWMPSWVIVSISLSCNVYFDSVRELELVADVHEHLVTRGSFEAVVLVIGVADDVLLQVLDQPGLELAQAFPYDGNGVPTSVLQLEFQ
ncbi:Hypothetical_protein [Hexamita inflata]|uniref:Hypothetical_protein n=1 Tax=Hexamita inflata TaxID=28002 RepID=A0AA86N5B7_9EUKA|nr:Hypothetical protein HINF_LOCUS802 [Hexamita inflata]